METAATAEARPTGLRRVMIVSCATVSTGTYAFTWNAVDVALPQMQGAFSATVDQVTWIYIAFGIGSAMMTGCVGWFSSRFGRKQLFLFSIAGYVVTLFGSAMATTLMEEVTWRFCQGVVGAPMIPLAQSIAVAAFPSDQQGKAISIWALGFVTANVFAPAVSGLLVENYGWPWVFYITVPIAVPVFIVSWLVVPVTEKDPRPLDWTGFLALIIGVGMLQLMLARGQRLDWFDSPEIVIEAVIAGIALYVLVTHSIMAKNPFFDRALFNDRNFGIGQVFTLMIGAVMFLPLLLLPLMLQRIAGYPPLEVGYLLMPRGIGSVIGLIVMSQIRDKFDPRPMIFIGILLTAWPAWTMAHWTVDVGPWDVAVPNFVQGCATSFIWSPLTRLTLSRIDDRVRDQGVSLYYLNFDIGASIGTAAIIGLHARHSQINRATLSEFVNPFNEAFRGATLPDTWSIAEASGLAALEHEVARQATMIAYNNSFLVISFTLVALIPLIFLFRHHPTKSAAP